ncbi:uncharacterized protein [Rutidosis leptorrhynchoides]|uniref:uncharacterized protein n=1 Tax=Rutidosis leptorrhynchoides TaxID=125765 RepID=UPI003A99E7DD
MNAVKEETPPVNLKTHSPVMQNPRFLKIPIIKKAPKHKPKFKILRLGTNSKKFSSRVKEFLHLHDCKLRFFMTWISPIGFFGDREILAIEGLFKSHPNACLVIVSNSLDSGKGNKTILKPFTDKGFKLIAAMPDFDYIFKNTSAAIWFNELKRGTIHPGDVPLGQNLSNLLRLALLYKFGGIYVDTDVVLLKSLSSLRNSIGAQTTDTETRNWTRLNNAVMIFDKEHPLLYEFIQEFSFTFNGNRWGHNGPYLVSRVASRVIDNPGFNFTVLNPSAFYPVDWSRIRSLFRKPKDEMHSKFLRKKLETIRNESFAVHLWNKHSRKFTVEEGSIIDHIRSDCCIFCNHSSSGVHVITK